MFCVSGMSFGFILVFLHDSQFYEKTILRKKHGVKLKLIKSIIYDSIGNYYLYYGLKKNVFASSADQQFLVNGFTTTALISKYYQIELYII